MKKAEVSALRIGLVLDHPSPHMVSLLDALADRDDCTAEIIYLSDAPTNRNWGTPKGRLPYKIVSVSQQSNALTRASRLTRMIGQARIDVWVLNTVYTSLETWIASRKMCSVAIPWVYMNEPIRPRGFATPFKESMWRQLLSGASGIIGMGDEATRRYRQLSSDRLPATSVPYYIDLDEFFNLAPRDVRIRPPIRFFVSAQMVHRKGYDVLLAAARLLPKQGWSLSIAGDGKMREELEHEIRSSSFRDNVTILGAVPFHDRAKYFGVHDVFVFPSRWDGWGMAPVEALASGLPVVATDQVMSMREFLVDGENGFLIPADDAVTLADRMRWFIENGSCIETMRLKARSSLRDYSAAEGATKIVKFLTELDLKSRRANVSRAVESELMYSPTWRSIERSRNFALRWEIRGRNAVKSAIISCRSIKGQEPRGNRILAYHLVLREDRNTFLEHIKFLKDHFTLVTAKELVTLRDTVSTPLAAITFDDTFHVLLQDALELLETNGIKATFFAPTGFNDRAENIEGIDEYCRRAFANHHALAPMSVDDLRTLHRLGHEIGSHGVSHVSMSSASEHYGRKQLIDSRERLTDWLGVKPSGFAYPYGDTSSVVGNPATWVAESGYDYAVTMRRGDVREASNVRLLPREHVEGNWPLRYLRYFLSR